jgi:hypothetical protein
MHSSEPREIHLVMRRHGPSCAYFDKDKAQAMCKLGWPENDWVMTIPINYGVPCTHEKTLTDYEVGSGGPFNVYCTACGLKLKENC